MSPHIAERTFLFLQGPLSPLYRLLGDALRARGAAVYRINFCFGDWLHWHGEGCINYRGRAAAWPDFLETCVRRHGITTLVLHGDSRFYHREAVTLAHKLDLEVIATELGLLRPGYLTLEWGGLSVNSRLPRNFDALAELAAKAPSAAANFRYPFSVMARWDAGYNLLNTAMAWLFPHYRRHTPLHPLLEYPAWIPRLLGEGRRQRRAAAAIEALRTGGGDYFVFPLQLSGDFQIREHSPYTSMHAAIEHVLCSFAACAGEHTQLVLKQHPLDCGLDGLYRHTSKLLQELGIAQRVHYIDGGDLGALLDGSRGVVTVNSTVGLEALQAGRPVMVLGGAIYDLDGLTHGAGLDDFWHTPAEPDRQRVQTFVAALQSYSQVAGALYGARGLTTAVSQMAERIAARGITPMSQLPVPGRRKNP